LANEVRTGLDEVVVTTPPKVVVSKKHPLDEMWMGKPVRQHVREFAAIFATIFCAVGAFKLYRGAPLSLGLIWGGCGIGFAALGYTAPAVLHPLWRAWMKLAHYLSIVMTFVILSLAWSIGFVPMAYILKIVGIKRIDVSYRSGVDSYWEKRDPKYDDFKRLELQF
jgi:hypothetical protein